MEGRAVPFFKEVVLVGNLPGHKQLKCHQFLVHSQTRNNLFAVRVVRVQWLTRVFLKFKLSCTIAVCRDVVQNYCTINFKQ